MATRQQIQQLQQQLDGQRTLQQVQKQRFQETVDTLRTDFQDTVSSLQDIINGFQQTIKSLQTEVQSLRSAAKESDNTLRNTRADLFLLSERTPEPRAPTSKTPPPRSSRASAHKVNSWRPQTLVDVLHYSPPPTSANINTFDATLLYKRTPVVSAARRWKYRLTGRCVRCGSLDHWVQNCQLLPTKPELPTDPKPLARTQGKSKASSIYVKTVELDDKDPPGTVMWSPGLAREKEYAQRCRELGLWEWE
jgi:uncharacterized membrane-anchored protein YhcB (DUF1043 family)